MKIAFFYTVLKNEQGTTKQGKTVGVCAAKTRAVQSSEPIFVIAQESIPSLAESIPGLLKRFQIRAQESKETGNCLLKRLFLNMFIV